MHRLFVAIDFPREVRAVLSALCHGIPHAKWMAEDQFHLTLKFIGEVDGGLLQDIADTLDEIESPPFSAGIQGFGVFPPRQEPRILWAGVSGEGGLSSLHKKIDRALTETGIPPEKRNFHPHITLARLQGAPLSRITDFLTKNDSFKTEPVDIREFVLYKSHLSPKGSVYEPLASYTLGKREDQN